MACGILVLWFIHFAEVAKDIQIRHLIMSTNKIQVIMVPPARFLTYKKFRDGQSKMILQI